MNNFVKHAKHAKYAIHPWYSSLHGSKPCWPNPLLWVGIWAKCQHLWDVTGSTIAFLQRNCLICLWSWILNMQIIFNWLKSFLMLDMLLWSWFPSSFSLFATFPEVYWSTCIIVIANHGLYLLFMASPLPGNRFLGPPKPARLCLLGLGSAFSGVLWMRIPQLPQFVLQVPALSETPLHLHGCLKPEWFQLGDLNLGFDSCSKMTLITTHQQSCLSLIWKKWEGLPPPCRPMWMMRFTYPSRMASNNWPVQSCVQKAV